MPASKHVDPVGLFLDQHPEPMDGYTLEWWDVHRDTVRLRRATFHVYAAWADHPFSKAYPDEADRTGKDFINQWALFSMSGGAWKPDGRTAERPTPAEAWQSLRKPVWTFPGTTRRITERDALYQAADYAAKREQAARDDVAHWTAVSGHLIHRIEILESD